MWTRFWRILKLTPFLLIGVTICSVASETAMNYQITKKKAVETLKNNMYRDLRTSFFTKEGATIRHAISDLKEVQIFPTYVCELASLPACNSLTVLLESPSESLNCGRWGFSTFNESGDLVWPRFLQHRTFNTYLDEIVLKCMHLF